MTLNLSGSTGVSGVDGSAATPALQGNDTNTGISFGTDVIIASTGGSERARIDSSGRLLVGTTSVGINANGAVAAIKGANLVAGTGQGQLAVITANAQAADVGGSISLGGQSTTADWQYATIAGRSENNGYAGYFQIATANSAGVIAERVRITSGGAAKFSNTGTYNSSTSIVHEFRSDQVANTVRIGNSTSSGTSASALLYLSQEAASQGFNAITYYAGAFGGAEYFRVLGTGNVQNSNNSYGGTSDIKLKTDIVPAGSQWSDIKSLSVVKYKWLYDQEGPVQIGLVAQEVEAISPGLVEESKDYDAEGNDLGTVTKSIKYSVLYMKAVKALQEAMERIETLEAKVAALENV